MRSTSTQNLSKLLDATELEKLKEDVLTYKDQVNTLNEKHRVVQTDYKNLIGITSELVSALANSVNGEPVYN